MRQTGNDNLTWLWGRCLVNQSIKYDKYALELWISTELAIENQFYKTKMKIFKESVFNRLVNLFTVRFLYLNVRQWDCSHNRESHAYLERSVSFLATCVKRSAIFYCPIKTTQPRPQVSRLPTLFPAFTLYYWRHCPDMVNVFQILSSLADNEKFGAGFEPIRNGKIILFWLNDKMN